MRGGGKRAVAMGRGVVDLRALMSYAVPSAHLREGTAGLMMAISVGLRPRPPSPLDENRMFCVCWYV
jgi:hypothetical protein